MLVKNQAHVSVEHYSQHFGNKKAVDNLSFEVKKGETFGFLGANGSGKTTTLRALLGIYEPSAGQLHIDGKRYQPDDGIRLGYLPEERGLYKKEPVLDIMVYFGILKGMPRKAARQWARQYLERVGLVDKEKVKLEKLSGGQQQKVQLGVTLMNDPELLILDEPTKGLDPVNRRLLMEAIEDQRSRGTTVMLVTHQMEEIERLCERVIILKDGQSAAYGETDDIRSQFGEEVVAVKFKGELPELPKLFTIRKQEAHFAELLPKSGVEHGEIMRALAEDKKVTVELFEVRKPSLEDVFVAIYKRAGEEE